jgi:phospholipase C
MLSCAGLPREGTPIPVETPPRVPDLKSSINHIVFMVQENRSFDHYFGKLNDYRVANGFGSPNDVDGLPPNASNSGPDGTPVLSFHLRTMCIENLSPDWLESHSDFNLRDPLSDTPTMDGFVHNAAEMAKCCNNNFFDVQGRRAMGYYDAGDLPYYYFMASQFATSDRFFAPVPTESEPNRMYLLAGTSHGFVHKDTLPRLPVPTIFHRLQDAGISWKVYYSSAFPDGTPLTDLNLFFTDFATAHSNRIVPVSQYMTDVATGQLPAVAFIQADFLGGRDEHPGATIPGNPNSGTHVQVGVAYVASLINALMFSPSWKDSVFIWSMDEAGGLYDHVPAVPAVHPDGIAPRDLEPGKDPAKDFTRTGFRVPMFVVSPFAKKHFVSHTVMDFTAILKFIETRFDLPPLTRRDAAQPDMTEFLDFANPPWTTPPTPPEQPTNGPCDVTFLD